MQSNRFGVPASLLGLPAPSLSGQHLSHSTGGQSVEVQPILHVESRKGVEVQVRLVDEISRIKGERGTGPSDDGGQSTQLSVDAGKHPVCRFGISFSETVEKLREGLRHASGDRQQERAPRVHQTRSFCPGA